jgi:sorbitol/mannitol transport system substrate-binding protein
VKFQSSGRKAVFAAAATLTVSALALSGCAPAAEVEDSKEINVLMVNNFTMQKLEELAPEYFTKETGIKVNITLMAENDIRDKNSQEFSAQANQYDVSSIGSYELQIYGRNGWLAPLDEYVLDDEEFNQGDILPAVQQLMTGDDGHIYGEPLETDSSFLMYNKDIFAAAGVEPPSDHPTWDEVVDIAAKLKAANPDVAAICNRGLPGWGQSGASLTTVVNTFGGTWFDEDWDAQVNSPEFVEATEFYVDMVNEYGPAGGAQIGVLECFNSFLAGQSAMWYDTTNAPSFLEVEGSPLLGKVGYVSAPVKETEASGWLFTWALAIEQASTNKDSAAAFIKWASSSEFEQLVAEKYGWAAASPGRRTSLYENPEYQAAGEAFLPAVQYAFDNADPNDPGVQPRPTVGIQYVTIPEFAQLGDSVTEEIASAIAGQQTVKEALDKGQALAEEVAEKYKD